MPNPDELFRLLVARAWTYSNFHAFLWGMIDLGSNGEYPQIPNGHKASHDQVRDFGGESKVFRLFNTLGLAI